MLQLELFTEELKKTIMAFIIKKDIKYLTIKLEKEHADVVPLYYNTRKYIEENKKYLSYKDNGEIAYLMAKLLFDLIKYEYLNYKQILTIQNHTSIEEQLLRDYTADAIRSSNLDEEEINELLRLAEMYDKKEISAFVSNVIIHLVNDLNPTKEEPKSSYIDVSYRKNIKHIGDEDKYDLGKLILLNSFPKKVFEKKEEVEDYGLLEIANETSNKPQDSLSLEQVYKIVRLKYLQFEATEKMLKQALKEHGINLMCVHDMKENYLRLSIMISSTSNWIDYELKFKNGVITMDGDSSQMTKVRSAFISEKEKLRTYLSFYQFYTQSLTKPINGQNTYFSISKVGVDVFYDKRTWLQSNIGSKFSILENAKS